MGKATRSSAAGPGGYALGHRRGATRGAGVAVLVIASLLFVFSLSTSSASAAEHVVISGEYGKEGPKATGIGDSCRMAYHGATERLYLYSDNKIYGLQRSGPGSVAPLGGSFPVTASLGKNSNCNDPDLTVDQASGSIYAVPSNAQIFGWSSTGSPLSAPWPVSQGSGEVCGVAVANNGNVFGGYYSGNTIVQYTSAGGSVGTIPFGQSICKLEVDQGNNDIFAVGYGSGTLFKLTAASGYSSKTTFLSGVPANSSLAINTVENRIYLASGSTVKAYDTNTGALVEEIAVGTTAREVVVDESTDTLFVQVESGPSGYIREYLGVKVPKATTGDPIGNDEVTGTADPNEAGSGEITECYFEFGLTTSYGSTQNCNEALPITSEQGVTANLPGLLGEQTYHYRLVLGTGEPGIVGRGADKTITPHYVDSLATEAASNVERTTATLNASFEGTNDPTSYYFEWGTTTAYGNQSAAPPGVSVGATTGPTPLNFNVTGLTAGTTYHFRVVATNSLGTSIGGDLTFTTDPAIKQLLTNPATEVTTTTAVLNGELDPDGLETTYYFQYGQTTAYGQTVPLPLGDPVGTSAPGLTPVSIEVTGLKPNLTYHFRLVGVNGTGTTFAADDQVFTTPQPPSILSFRSKNVTGSSADLEARINPNGEETEYFFDYGPSTSYGSTAPAPPGLLPAGNTAEVVTVPITGLTGIPYHFRIIAKNKWGTTTSANQTFSFYPEPCPNAAVRQQTGSGHVPDCRAYELVSPARAGTVNLFAAGAQSPYASNPPRIMYSGNFGSLKGAHAPNFLFDPYVATRTSTGWETHYAGIPSEVAGGVGGQPGLHAGPFNGAPVADQGLDKIVHWRFTNASVFGAYYYTGTRHYAPYVYGPTGEYLGRYPTNLASVPDADNPIKFGFGFELVDEPDNGWTGDQELSDDGNHYFFSTNRYAFAEGGLVSRDAGPGSVYDNDTETGVVTIASKLPGTVGGGDIPAESSLPNHFLEIYKSSTDGTHLLIAAPSQCNSGGNPSAYFLCAETFKYAPAHLYMRVDGAITYDVSQGARVNFQGMTRDGGTVYFTSAEKLTEDDSDTSIDLFVWREATDEITRVSVGSGGSGAGNTDACSPASGWIAKCGVEVLPATGGQDNEELKNVGLSEATDNSVAGHSGDIYFYSPERLVDSSATPNQRNLYVLREGAVEFVAQLEAPNNRRITRVQVTPTGSHAAFVTASPLTAYNSAGKEMMYLYDAEAQQVTCVSCDPSGAPPANSVKASLNGLFLSDDGRPFWNTIDPLVPRDTNQDTDVYEYSGGRAQLITSGIAEKVRGHIVTGGGLNDVFGKFFWIKPGLIGVSADGLDVYFVTRDTLAPQDENGAYPKIYNARTNGGFPVAAQVAPCEAADECHGPTFTPSAPSVTSTAGLGTGGNVSQTKKFKKNTRKKGSARHGARKGRHHQGRAGKGDRVNRATRRAGSKSASRRAHGTGRAGK